MDIEAGRAGGDRVMDIEAGKLAADRLVDIGVVEPGAAGIEGVWAAARSK